MENKFKTLLKPIKWEKGKEEYLYVYMTHTYIGNFYIYKNKDKHYWGNKAELIYGNDTNSIREAKQGFENYYIEQIMHFFDIKKLKKLLGKK